MEMDCIQDPEQINSIKQSLNISSLPDIHVCKSENNTVILRAEYRDEADLQPLFKAWEATWRISRTHPKNMSAGIKNVYYKEYHCQHSDLRISAGQFLPHDKHCGCQARLTITITKIGKRCRAKDPHLPSYPTIIKLFNQHNHALDSADALKCKDVSTETKNKFLALFENGHSPYSALESHQMDLQNLYGEDYYVKATDRSLCPDLNWCYKLFHDIRGKLYGEFSQDATEVMLQKLSKIKTDNNDSLIYEIDDDGKPIVAVMTPFMKRVHRKINHSSEIVFMDSTGGFDSLQHRVFILMTHSYMGALPLGLVITTTEKADSIAKGLRLLLKLMSPDEVFYGKKTPAMILTDNSAAERSALRSVFPGAILLLCIFHILQAVWRYLWKAENHVEKSDKNNLFNMFKKLLYSKTEADLNAQYKFIIDRKVTQKYPKVLNYYMDLWAQKADWALCFRNTLLTRQNNTNNYAEATMRVLKDKIFHRTRAYNIIQLIDFLVTKIDPYYERKLLNFAAGRNIQTHLQARYSLDVLNKKAESFEIHGSQDNDAVFKVKNLTKNTEYVVNLELEMCTCFVGNTGGPCKHQAAVLVEKKSNTMNFFVGDEDQRRFIHELATGKTVPSNFYAKLSDLPSDNQHQVEVLPVVGEKRSTEEQMDIDCSVSTTSAPMLAVPTLRDITNITATTPSTTATAINIDDDDGDDELFMPTFDVQY